MESEIYILLSFGIYTVEGNKSAFIKHGHRLPVSSTMFRLPVTMFSRRQERLTSSCGIQPMEWNGLKRSRKNNYSHNACEKLPHILMESFIATGPLLHTTKGPGQSNRRPIVPFAGFAKEAKGPTAGGGRKNLRLRNY